MMEEKLQQQNRQRCIDDMTAVALNRDREAFARLFDEFLPRIRSFCLAARPGYTLLAEEVAQEVMIKVWNKAHTYNAEAAAVSTWIFTLARNARIDYLRKNSRHESNIDPTDLWEEVVDEESDPFMTTLQKRSEEEIKKAIKGLPQDQIQVLTKIYMEGNTHSEVSEELNIPLGTVKSRVRLALKKLAISVKR
jgi:RNA polymerase sigma-70 factor (ECF subfamily)